MLYYIIKFINLVFRQPRKLATHLRRLRREWKEDCTSRLVTDVIHVTTSNWELSYGSNNYSARIIQYIVRAKYSIDLAMYSILLESLCEALVEASRRGVRVRIICDIGYERMVENYGKVLELRFISLNSIDKSRDPTMHHKFCVIDGYRSKKLHSHKDARGSAPIVTIAMTGSLNWVRSYQYWDNFLITSSPRVCRRLETEFERMWKPTFI